MADTENHRIQKFTSNGNFMGKWGSPGSGDGQFLGPKGIALDASGNIYVADTENYRIQKFTFDGEFLSKWGSYGSVNGQFLEPSGIAVGAFGNVYVLDTGNYRIQVFQVLGTPNRAPIAKAGPDQQGYLGSVVTLDGSASSDPDGNYPLGYAWQIVSKPASSTASLTGSNTVSPTFKPDVPGNYIVRLVVTDSLGRESSPDEVTVSTANTVPVAYAGTDQELALVGTTVYLDGTGSHDDNGDSLTYSWTITTKPAGSGATLAGSTSPTPSFVADIEGIYQITLVVTDPWGAKSSPDTVVASFNNLAPVAQVEANQSRVVGDTVLLDASPSSDPNGDPLTYKWSLVSKPDGSLAGLSADAGPSTTFIADAAGSYVVSLIANDGPVDSAPCNVTVVVITKQTETTQTLTEAVNAINDTTTFPDDAFKNDTMRNPLTNKINVVIGMIDQERYQEALDKLKTDILPKTDGCAVSGEPDKNDWIKTCAQQAELHNGLLMPLRFWKP